MQLIGPRSGHEADYRAAGAAELGTIVARQDLIFTYGFDTGKPSRKGARRGIGKIANGSAINQEIVVIDPCPIYGHFGLAWSRLDLEVCQRTNVAYTGIKSSQLEQVSTLQR